MLASEDTQRQNSPLSGSSLSPSIYLFWLCWCQLNSSSLVLARASSSCQRERGGGLLSVANNGSNRRVIQCEGQVGAHRDYFMRVTQLYAPHLYATLLACRASISIYMDVGASQMARPALSNRYCLMTASNVRPNNPGRDLALESPGTSRCSGD